MWHACRTHMGKVPRGMFHSHNFRHVMGFILHNVVPKYKSVPIERAGRGPQNSYML